MFARLVDGSFLMGPKTQLKRMTRARRRWATAVYVLAMILTVTFALTLEGPMSKLIVLLCVFIQWCALIWYIASYIPYGQKLIVSVLGRAANM